MNPDSFKYTAFISYCHADAEWADWLHRSLEKFTIPKALRNEENRALPNSFYPIFKDREELPTSSALEDRITDALEASRYLIVICSPKAARSKWVNEEIAIFKSLGRGDRILCLIIDGEPFASDNLNQFQGKSSHPLRRAIDVQGNAIAQTSSESTNSNSNIKMAAEECFPPAVRYEVGADRQILPVRAEPVAADVREGKDGKSLALSKLIAGILKVDLFQLTQRQHQRRINRLKLLAVMMLVLVTAFAGIAFKAWVAQKKAEELSLVALSRQLSTHANSLFDSDQSLRVNMLLAGVHAHGFAPTNEAISATFKTVFATKSIKTILATESAVMNIAYSKNGKYLAAATDNGQIFIWDLATMLLVYEPLVGHDGSILKITFSPDETSLVSTGVDEKVIVWDLNLGQPKTRPTFKSLDAHNDWVVDVDFAPDGESFVTSSWDGKVIIWNNSSLTPSTELPLTQSGWASSVEFSPDGNWLAIGREDGSVEIWDVNSVKLSNEILLGHKDWVTDLSFSNNSKYLASASSDGTAITWDMETRTLRHFVPDEPGLGLTSVTFSHDDQTLITGGWDRKVNIWNVDSGAMHIEPFNGHSEQVTSVDINPSGDTFASAGHDGSIIIWDTRINYPFKRHHCSRTSRINSIEFNPSGTVLAIASTNADLILCSLTGKTEPHHITKNIIKSLAYNQNGSRLAIINNEHEINQYDPKTLTPLADTIDLSPNVITSLAYSPDNRFLAIGDRNSNIHVWQVESAQLVKTLTGHEGPILDLDFSSDSKTLASASEDSQIFLWDVKDTDVTQLAILGGNFFPVTAIAFQPNSNHILASGSEDGILTFWNTTKAEPIGLPITVHDGSINALSFSMNGALVATGGSDMLISIRETQSLKQIGSKLSAHADQITVLEFSPNSYMLASGSADGTILFWDLDIENWKENICKKVVRKLTHIEWDLHVGDIIPYQNECNETPAESP
ncbi:TIR domain-containing protein [Aliiglaciecola litoralis]|uniref:TIR domain-containing protein n=1 Tax=Aliiglaciecola litoralis TaxID=582857 RepID=A0ABN1LRX8_9ALTE